MQFLSNTCIFPPGWPEDRPQRKEAALAREDLIEVEGIITDVHPGGLFTVQLDNDGPQIQARVGGKMRQHFIRIVLGDRVKVGVSPYDPTHGIITYRTR